jgi:hypothetical protein
MAYYENRGMLREHANHWLRLPHDIANNLHVIVVDDGSPDEDAAPELEGFNTIPWTGRGLASLQVWRMTQDIRWNQDACRNVGMREAPTRWRLMTDMDHLVPVETWRFLMTAKLSKHRAYRFGRVTAPRMDPYKPHPNSWALERDLYWSAGGYDEALAGLYGTDGDFKVRLSRVAEIHDLSAHIIRYPRDLIPDASTTTLERKSQGDSDQIKALIKRRGKDWKPRHFSFDCRRVL